MAPCSVEIPGKKSQVSQDTTHEVVDLYHFFLFFFLFFIFFSLAKLLMSEISTVSLKLTQM